MSFIINPYSFGFNPLSLSPALWLSDTGSDPAVWPDLSGNGRNATQSSTTSQPSIVANGLNGRQVRRFDGVDDCLFYPDFHTANITIFAVYKPANNGNIQTLLRKGFTTGLSGEYNMRANNATTVLFGLPSAFASSTKAAGGNWIVQAGWADSSFVSSSVNGGSVTSVSGASAIPNNSFRGRIGSSYASESDTAGFGQLLFGDIAEILIYPTALSTANRQAVESYLRTKWGTP